MNINLAEQTALQQSLSNEARVLYLLGLKPKVNNHNATTPPLNYKTLLALLNAKEEKLTLGRQLNSLIKELLNVGLVKFDQDVELNHSFNGKTLLLPLLQMKPDAYSKLHLEWYTMQLDWQPDHALLSDLAKLVGLIDYQYSEAELGRPESHFSQFQWTQKFVFNLKRNRVVAGGATVHRVGQQLVKQTAGIVADENAKNLVAKYSKK
jgi:DNA replication protein DnaT